MFFCHQKTSTYHVIEDAIFGRMDDIGDMFKKEVHQEFIANSLCKAPGNFFPEYSFLYVLVAHGPSNKLVPPSEKKWSDILDEEQNVVLQKHHAFVIAWMLMSPKSPVGTHFIEYIESRVRGYNLADCMIKKYENELAVTEETNRNHIGCVQIKPKCVLPREVTLQSSQFWCKYFKRRFDVRDKKGLCELAQTLKIENLVYWHFLEFHFYPQTSLKHTVRYAHHF
jgi:hypothetical protein